MTQEAAQRAEQEIFQPMRCRNINWAAEMGSTAANKKQQEKMAAGITDRILICSSDESIVGASRAVVAWAISWFSHPRTSQGVTVIKPRNGTIGDVCRISNKRKSWKSNSN
jgi:hypothetical protein